MVPSSVDRIYILVWILSKREVVDQSYRAIEPNKVGVIKDIRVLQILQLEMRILCVVIYRRMQRVIH